MLKLRIPIKGDVYIGDNIKVIVLAVHQHPLRVELGFKAPPEIKILRGNLVNKDHNSTQLDAATNSVDTNSEAP